MIPCHLQAVGRSIAQRARALRGAAHLDLHDPSGTVLLVGSGRGGTTWLSQIINHNNTYRDIFEPFSPGKTPAVSHYPEQLYLRPDEAGEDYRDAAAALLIVPAQVLGSLDAQSIRGATNLRGAA